MRENVRRLIEQHPDASVVDEDDTGRLSVEVPHTIPRDLDQQLRDHGVTVTRKTATRFEVGM